MKIPQMKVFLLIWGGVRRGRLNRPNNVFSKYLTPKEDSKKPSVAALKMNADEDILFVKGRY